MTNHPKDLSEKLVKALSESDKTCRSIHLPIQAGSTRVLKLMNRRYTREDYLEKVKLLRKYIPDVAITTDIMVSFPTETEEDMRAIPELGNEIAALYYETVPKDKRNGKCQITMSTSFFIPKPWFSIKFSIKLVSKLVSRKKNIILSYTCHYGPFLGNCHIM